MPEIDCETLALINSLKSELQTQRNAILYLQNSVAFRKRNRAGGSIDMVSVSNANNGNAIRHRRITSTVTTFTLPSVSSSVPRHRRCGSIVSPLGGGGGLNVVSGLSVRHRRAVSTITSVADGPIYNVITGTAIRHRRVSSTVTPLTGGTTIQVVSGIVTRHRRTTSTVTRTPTVGEIRIAGSSSPLPGCLNCDGSTFSSTTYPELAAYLGDTFGLHTGTSYVLPDLRRRSPVGIGGSQTFGPSTVIGSSWSEEGHTLTVVETASHNHGPSVGTSVLEFTASGGVSALGAGSFQFLPEGHGGNTGGGSAHNNYHPSLVVNFCIQT